MTRVLVRVDRLVLRGFAHADRENVVRTLQEELARELGAPAAQFVADEQSHGRAIALPVRRGASPADTARSAARTIARSLMK
jgi:hypothetical protein